ncbi:unnamed protein product [Lampetra fluviatilis]
MSKHLKIKNPPAPSSDDDDDSLNQDLPTPGAADPVTATAVASAKAPGKDVGAEPSSPLARDYGWRRVAEQINSLCTVLLNLVTLVASSVAPGRPQDTLPSRDEQGFLWRSRKGRVRKFMHRCHGANESPLAYRRTLLALAMAAYPDSTPDILDPLILARMLELSREMGISLPVWSHEPLTSRSTRGSKDCYGQDPGLERAMRSSVVTRHVMGCGRPRLAPLSLLLPTTPLRLGLSPPRRTLNLPLFRLLLRWNRRGLMLLLGMDRRRVHVPDLGVWERESVGKLCAEVTTTNTRNESGAVSV